MMSCVGQSKLDAAVVWSQKILFLMNCVESNHPLCGLHCDSEGIKRISSVIITEESLTLVEAAVISVLVSIEYLIT